ncbi:Oligoendopeptidase F [hydrothermal vent metagenome]|uniref:Oligoendopeptidase F n=1 Tax=hydrothermal vent metagenome TaxID=652676 RepID=A0A3B1C9V2_9ZZZZ
MTTKSAQWLAPFDRSFVEKDQKITNWDDLAPYFEKLEKTSLESEADLKAWLLNWSEVLSAAHEYVSQRYIEMTCHTDDKKKKEAYLVCVRELEPKLSEFDDRLNRKYYDSKLRDGLDKSEYGQLNRMIATSIELFDEKNIPIQVKLQELSQKYQELMGAMTVMFDGEEKTMPQMSNYLREPDRDLRQRAFTTTAERRLKEKDKLDELFDAMLKQRSDFAENLGLENYRDYCFKSKLRDYTADDCFKFHEAIEKTAVPLARKISSQRLAKMGVDKLCPWDTECDEEGRPPLKPFDKVEELAKGVTDIFMSVDERLGERFDSIRFSMDLQSRKGKAPGGYQATLEEARIPFIFTNAVGSHSDVNTLLHEGGHAFHTLQSRGLPLIWYRHSAMEFAEVASMTQELIGGDQLEPFYSDPEDRLRARREHLKGVVGLFGWVARVDAFQHWIYTNPGHHKDSRNKEWLKLAKRFSVGVDWSGAPAGALDYLWHRQLHIFELPFYYVEYAIAQLGALQIYREYRRDANKAIDNYLNALSLGGSFPAPQLFETAGIKFDFSANLLGELMEMVEQELGL